MSAPNYKIRDAEHVREITSALKTVTANTNQYELATALELAQSSISMALGCNSSTWKGAINRGYIERQHQKTLEKICANVGVDFADVYAQTHQVGLAELFVDAVREYVLEKLTSLIGDPVLAANVEPTTTNHLMAKIKSALHDPKKVKAMITALGLEEPETSISQEPRNR